MERLSKKRLSGLVHRYEAGELSIEQFAREYTAVLEGRPRLEKTLDELNKIASQGLDHLNAWEEIYKAIHSDDVDLVDLAPWYFFLTGIAHLEIATLQAAKLTENHGDSVNLEYLLNLLTDRCQANFPSNWREVRKSVDIDRTQLSDLKPIVSRIKTERDKRIAHHDRSNLSATSDDVTRIEATELENVLQTIRNIVTRYYIYYYGEVPTMPSSDYGSTGLLGPKGLGELFHLARKALDDETINDVSHHVKRIRAWRRTLRVMKDIEDDSE